jgi:hypothetical protein
MVSIRLCGAFAAFALVLSGCAAEDQGKPRADAQRPETSQTTASPEALSPTRLAKQVRARYQKKGLKVTCPQGLAGQAGATSDCEATDGSKLVGVRATATDARGGFDVLPFLGADAVVDTIAGSLEMQGYTGVTGHCDGELIGEVGAHQDCEVTTSGGTTPVNVDVTKVEGLTIDFTFKG